MERGIPAVVSDIPVMREMVERAGGEVLWFDPRSPESLREALRELEQDYPRYRERARSQVRRLRTRTWSDVAGGYATLMGYPALPGKGVADA
jgi:glycosyltransferase involved in cell wall biosynthesis